jgi:hypothetical protein
MADFGYWDYALAMSLFPCCFASACWGVNGSVLTLGADISVRVSGVVFVETPVEEYGDCIVMPSKTPKWGIADTRPT